MLLWLSPSNEFQDFNVLKLKVKFFLCREGSVIADFELAFKNKTASPLRPLKSAIRNGTLGDLEVIPKSLIIKEENNIGKCNKFRTTYIVQRACNVGTFLGIYTHFKVCHLNKYI